MKIPSNWQKGWRVWKEKKKPVNHHVAFGSLSRVNVAILSSIPDCELRFKDRNFSNAPRLIEQSRFEGSATSGDRRQDVPIIQEINLFALGPRRLPHLVALIADQLIIYKYRPYKIKYEAKTPVLGLLQIFLGI